MALAVPSLAFDDVQRTLKQRRAGGQTVTPREARYAWQAYWDVNAARALQSRELGLRERSINANIDINRQNLELQKKRMKREQDAAKVSGIAELGSMGAMSAFALKGTSIGSKVGLGSVGAAPAQTGGAALSTTGGAALLPGAGSAAASEAGAAIGGFGSAAEAASFAPTTAATPLAGLAAPAAGGAAAGFLGSELGEKAFGNDAGEVVGGLVGGAAAGAIIGGPPGAIVGGVIGGAIGAVKAIKD